jgi:thiosulfate/3-mercaptopyruvate sulfurtransferase
VFVDLDRDLSGPPGPGGRHPLPAPGAFQAVMRRAGVGHDRPVVAYDQGQPGGAARAWWLLGWFGHPGARVLDGGLPAWVAAELATAGVLLDARAPARYQGLEEPVDPVAGHIPGARNAPITDFAGDPGLPPPGRLRELLAAHGAGDGVPVGAYCGSGVVAAHLVLALEVAGVPAALYPGSWSEWVADPSRPVATGATP